MEVVTKPVDTAQPIQQEVVSKPVDTAQLIQQEVVTKPVATAQPIQQVPITQQPDCHEHVMVEDPIASKDQVQFRMATNNILLSPITWGVI